MITNEDVRIQRRILSITLSSFPGVSQFAQELLAVTPNAWFTDHGARIAHQCINAQQSPDSYTVAKAIQESGLLEGPAFSQLMADLVYSDATTPTRAQIRLTLDLIRGAYIRHRLETMTDTIASATASGVTPEDGMAMVESEMASIRAASESGVVTFGSVKTSVKRLVSEIEAIQDQLQNAEPTPVISTGIENLDRQLFAGGFVPGQMIFVGARPGQGKSSFLVTCAVNMARAGRRVGIITLEMRDTEIAGVMVQHCGNVSLKPIFDRVMNADEMMGFHQGAAEVSDFTIWMDASTSMNIEQVCSRIAHMVHSVGCEIVFVDYTQRIKRRAHSSTFDELTLISERLTDQAKHLNIPIVGLVQLNREVEGLPSLEHFKGTGQFEQDAHIAILLHRPNANALDKELTIPGIEPMQIILAKQRRGATGVLPATFTRAIQRIS